MRPPFVMTEKSIAITIAGRTFNFTDAHPNWASIRSAIKNRKWGRIANLVDIARSLRRFSHGQVEIKHGEVVWKGKPVHNVIATRILKMRQEGAQFKPLVRFLDNLMKNPLQSAIDDLYLFLEHGDHPITVDGHFLAFKKVRDDYKDCWTRTFNNKVGKVVRMKRADCNPNRNETCSRGLHFCAESYLPSYGGQRAVIVKVNPKDVVAIPSDYKNAKGRTCRYEVVGELGVDYTGEDMRKAVAKHIPRDPKQKQSARRSR